MGLYLFCEGSKPCALPHQETSCIEASSLTPELYACTVFHPLPVYQEKRLQRLQDACARFVTRKFAGLEDVIKLNWLPVKENVEFNILKLAESASTNCL